MAIRPVRLTALGCLTAPIGLVLMVILFFVGVGFLNMVGSYFGHKTLQETNSSSRNRVADPPLVEPSALIPSSIWNARTRFIAQTAHQETVELPMIKSDYRVDIRGNMATVRVRQTFKNPGTSPLNAEYEFPLHEKSAVYAMTMRNGNRRIRAEIQRKEEAEKTFKKARREGKGAALLAQDRPNLFRQSIANLMPGEPVEVDLHYVQSLEKTDGRYQLDLPLVVGPRYQPGDMSENYLVAYPGGGNDAYAYQYARSDHLLDQPLPTTIDAERISIEVRIDGGMPMGRIESASHRLSRTQIAPNIWEVQLDEGREVPNKHFSLSYQLGGAETTSGLVSYYDPGAEKGYFGLLIEPPATLEAEAEEIFPREMVFVIDRSGSMSGAPMEANKAYMRHTLQNLRRSDTFRLIEFSQAANEFSKAPMPATPRNIAAALAYIEAMGANGGTNIKGAIDQALSPPVADGHLRLVTFLTDGYVSNEFETLRTLNEKRGQARLFAIGVGSRVNRYLLGEMGSMGHGFTEYVDPGKDVRSQAVAIAERLQTPILSNIRVDWGGLVQDEKSVSQIPDLFAGQSVRVLGTFKKPGTYQVVVHGRTGRGPVRFPLQVTVSDQPGAGRAVELAWARSTIDDYMNDLLTHVDNRENNLSDLQIQDLVTSLALEHSLVTQWTSFVAVSEQIVNPDGATARKTRQTSLYALAESAGEPPRDYYSNHHAPGGGGNYGYAPSAPGTPEPTTWAGLLLAALAVVFAMWGPRRREHPSG